MTNYYMQDANGNDTELKYNDDNNIEFERTFTDDSLENAAIIFQAPKGHEVFRVDKDGIKYRDRVLEMDADVEQAFKEFLKAQGYMGDNYEL